MNPSDRHATHIGKRQGLAPSLPQFIDSLQYVPWFRNLGRPNTRDRQVKRIHRWQEWQGPEAGYGDWFGRFPALVREQMEADHPTRKAELNQTWNRIELSVIELAIPHVPDYDAEQDAWYGPTACVWQAGYNAALVGCHLQLGRPLPEPIADQWDWLLEGHWPCDYAEEPLGYWTSLIDVPASRLVVF